MTETGNLLEVKNLAKVFDVGAGIRPKKIHAVNEVSFSLDKGHITALVGESGSGKSTVARLIARLLVPTAGSISLNGRMLPRGWVSRKRLLDYRAHVQMIFQDPFGALNSHYVVENHLMTPLINYRVGGSRDARERLIAETLDAVGLEPSVMLKRYPHELSGGQRQRVVIAKALVLGPDLLLADEPTSMLDVSIRVSILNLLENLRRKRHVSVLFISHDIASARYFADDIYVMYAGMLIEGGTADEVVENPLHPYTKLLLSAVPDVTDGLIHREVTVIGEPPNLSKRPEGCPFRLRCPEAMDICKTAPPRHTETHSTHWTECHLYTSSKE